MTEVRQRVVNAGGVPMSALVSEPEPATRGPHAVIVALHGDATTSAYFDCPGHPELSLLRAGAAAGYTVVALDRPGYGASAPYPQEMAAPEQRVSLAYTAIDRILADRPRGSGLFVVGHSAGCQLALRMVADGLRSDLLGVELAGTGRHFTPAAREVLRTARPDHRPAGLKELLWEPARLYPPGVATRISSTSGGAESEAEAATASDWSHSAFPALAAAVSVPVQYSVAEHEKVWQVDPDARAGIAALFTAAGFVSVNEQPEAGHNLSLCWNADVYHRSVFSFIERCAMTDIPNEVDQEVG